MGFLRKLCDLVGLDVEIASGIQYLEYFPERIYKSMLLSLMIAGKRAGRFKSVSCKLRKLLPKVVSLRVSMNL